jgi:hypothetical protein
MVFKNVTTLYHTRLVRKASQLRKLGQVPQSTWGDGRLLVQTRNHATAAEIEGLRNGTRDETYREEKRRRDGGDDKQKTRDDHDSGDSRRTRDRSDNRYAYGGDAI